MGDGGEKNGDLEAGGALKGAWVLRRFGGRSNANLPLALSRAQAPETDRREPGNYIATSVCRGLWDWNTA